MESSDEKRIKFEEGSKDSDKLNSVGLYLKPKEIEVHYSCTLIDWATELALCTWQIN